MKSQLTPQQKIEYATAYNDFGQKYPQWQAIKERMQQIADESETIEQVINTAFRSLPKTEQAKIYALILVDRGEEENEDEPETDQKLGW